MARFEKGLVYTKENCIGCNKCVSQCSILGTNITRLKDESMHIIVDSKKCVHCGKCIDACIHNARDYEDDTEEVFLNLASGKKLSLIVDSTFYTLYGDNASSILGYMRSKGVEKIYDAAYGMEISIWCHVKYIKDHIDIPADQKAFISQNCSALINMISMYYPYLQRRIIPVQSGAMCTAIYARKYLNDQNDFAYLGPCISKKDDFKQTDVPFTINYNMTYNHFMKHIRNLNIEDFSTESDLKPLGLGNIPECLGGMKEVISYFFPRGENLLLVENFNNEALERINTYVRANDDAVLPLFADSTSCINGCFKGPGIEKEHYNPITVRLKHAEVYKKAFESFDTSFDYEKHWEYLQNHFADLNSADFKRTFVDNFRQPFIIPESTLDEIFNTMLKFTPESRNINCASCGYKTCKDMAVAIAYAYSKKENCIHYMNEEIKKHLFTDIETGSPNKVAFIRNLPKLIEKHPEKEFIIGSGNINRLKIINDLYGTACGDSVLKIIGNTLKTIVGSEGLYARFGGNHFVLCFEYNVENMQRLQALKQFDCSELGITFPVTMRFGLYKTEHIPEEKSIPYMINSANLAMDKATSTMINTYNLFTRDVREKLLMDASISALMPSALDNREFVLWFQPQFDAQTNTIVGAEALCRWIKPDGTLISPGLFIPIAEKNGFISYLDNAIWRMAFSTVKRWMESGLKTVPISVNISRETLSSDSLFYTIKRLKDEFQIPTDLIHFEITESAYMDEQGVFLDLISKIRSLGFKIAMDDFGSGYSSLNSLKNIDIDFLKLDMGFIKEADRNPKAKSIISSVISMSKDLNVTTIAEGVETKDQSAFLANEGCNIIQGYYYSKPIPEGSFIEYLRIKK